MSQAVDRISDTRQAVPPKVRSRGKRPASPPKAPPKARPTSRRTLRALGGRRVVIEGFGKHAPALVAIGGSGEAPAGAWLSPAELRRLVEAVKRILK